MNVRLQLAGDREISPSLEVAGRHEARQAYQLQLSATPSDVLPICQAASLPPVADTVEAFTTAEHTHGEGRQHSCALLLCRW